MLIREDQDDFIKSQSQRFNFSKFVRDKLDEYMGMVDGEETTE